jgi:hypothetical protein
MSAQLDGYPPKIGTNDYCVIYKNALPKPGRFILVLKARVLVPTAAPPTAF